MFQNHKMNPRLCGNSRGSPYMKRQAQRQAKADSWKLCRAALGDADISADEFLTGRGRYNSLSALPLLVVCKRFYSGHSKLMDQDGCLIGFKYHLDAIAETLGVNDRDFELRLEQRRVASGHWLGIEVTPAWAVAVEKERAG
jgi:hypothetical protein